MKCNRMLPSAIQEHSTLLRDYFGRIEFMEEWEVLSNGFDLKKSLKEPNPKDVTLFFMHCVWQQLHETLRSTRAPSLPKWSSQFIPNYSVEQLSILDDSVAKAEGWLESVRADYLKSLYIRGGLTPTERAILERDDVVNFELHCCVLLCWSKINWLLETLSFSYGKKQRIVLENEREIVSKMCSRKGFKEQISKLDMFALGRRLPGAGFTKQ